MLTRILLAAAMVTAACADDTDDNNLQPADDPAGPAANPVDEPKSVDEPASDSTVEGIINGPHRVQCLNEGPCSPACTADMIIDIHVNPGSCVQFDCGAGKTVGGCRP